MGLLQKVFDCFRHSLSKPVTLWVPGTSGDMLESVLMRKLSHFLELHTGVCCLFIELPLYDVRKGLLKDLWQYILDPGWSVWWLQTDLMLPLARDTQACRKESSYTIHVYRLRLPAYWTCIEKMKKMASDNIFHSSGDLLLVSSQGGLVQVTTVS